MSDDPYKLERFTVAQDRNGSYDRALAELREGRKQSHWMWWIFPQFSGLGLSPTSREYALSSIDEARAYLVHPTLGPRLREVAEALLGHAGQGIEAIVNGDAVKVGSSMTLFMRARPEDQLFSRVLEVFFDSVPDAMTDQLLHSA